MARPQKCGMDYFPHDTDSLSDEKIEALRMLYGNDGYAFYFILLERIYRTENFELDISDAETKQILSRKIGITEEKFEKMLSTALKQKCFCKEYYESNGCLTSKGIKKRADVVLSKRIAAKKTYNSMVSATETTQETYTESTQRKGKESRENKNIYLAEIIDYLNQKTGKSFKISSDKTKTCLNARWNDGFTELQDYKTVIDKKCKEWLRNKDMEKFLRPETLFGTKFESYVNEKSNKPISPQELKWAE